MTTGTTFLMVYAAGCLVMLVPTARFYIDSVCDDADDRETFDYVMAAALSLCTTWAWPLYLPGWWIVEMLKTDKPKVKR